MWLRDTLDSVLSVRVVLVVRTLSFNDLFVYRFFPQESTLSLAMRRRQLQDEIALVDQEFQAVSFVSRTTLLLHTGFCRVILLSVMQHGCFMRKRSERGRATIFLRHSVCFRRSPSLATDGRHSYGSLPLYNIACLSFPKKPKRYKCLKCTFIS